MPVPKVMKNIPLAVFFILLVPLSNPCDAVTPAFSQDSPAMQNDSCSCVNATEDQYAAVLKENADKMHQSLRNKTNWFQKVQPSPYNLLEANKIVDFRPGTAPPTPETPSRPPSC